MKEKLLLFLILISFGINAQDINFTDPVFKAVLLSATTSNNVAKNNYGNAIVVDANADNQIQQDEALAVFTLDISGSGITDVTGIEYFTSLQTLNCNNNNLTQLDLNSNTALTYLDCTANNLQMLFIKNGQDETLAPGTWSSNIPLQYVCADDFQVAALAGTLPGSINLNAYCSFTPGGDYNTITGTLTVDADNNGCDSADPVQSFIKVTVNNGTEDISVFTNPFGGYNFYTQQTGTFTVTPQFEEPVYFSATPVTAPVNFPVIDNTIITQNFCITPTGANPDIEIVMAPVVEAVPGNTAHYKMVYKNKGNQVVSGNVQCTWDYTLFDFYSNSFTPAPDNTQVVGDMATYTWNFTNLQPFENREVTISLGVHTNTDGYPVNEGDVISFYASANLTGDIAPQDNTYQLDQKVMGAVTANNIVCIEGETEPGTAIGEYLHYIVNFKNMGMQTANSIVIEQEIDPAQFDSNTVEILNSSHNVNARMRGNILQVIFNNINLATDDHGNILFKVKTRPSLLGGTSVNSQARIFYDYNPPVQTNIATTSFGTMGVDDFIKNRVAVYPNPSDGIVNIVSDENIISVQLYDIQGRQLQTESKSGTEVSLDLSGRPKGIYLVKIITNNGASISKIMKK
ncbi:T9SS type A sorting domain-containing protein [Flavobacterium rhizosphaerae]|uniref:T9SS type A sorting domain-containing protein n=1 Tax=Flavobacterium rhizosphaerae TaxID=3163298 RepID=A0ABW8Z1W5_9FLAO